MDRSLWAQQAGMAIPGRLDFRGKGMRCESFSLGQGQVPPHSGPPSLPKDLEGFLMSTFSREKAGEIECLWPPNMSGGSVNSDLLSV